MRVFSKMTTYLVHNRLEEEGQDHGPVTAMMMTHKANQSTPKRGTAETDQVALDTDSYEMRIDTGASHCISYDKGDFVGKLTPTRGSIQGYHDVDSSGRLYLGTLKFSLTDDEGKQHVFNVPNSICDVQGQHKLLCPQHWS